MTFVRQPSMALVVVLTLALATRTTHAFAVSPLAARYQSNTPSMVVGVSPVPQLRLKTTLYREEEDNNNEAPPASAEATEESTDDDSEEGAPAAQEEPPAEEEPPQEDPELTALKEEIRALEKTLKEKGMKVEYLKNDLDEYSKGGYARKVAEMENMRRIRSSMASSNKETSIANILRQFLPVVDQLEALRAKHQGDDFGKQYVALAGNMKTAMSNLGVSEYTAAAGQPMERTRMVAVQEEYSAEQPKNAVLECLRPGLELKGNVVRLAEVKTSLGDEAAAKSAQEEAAAKAAAAAEAGEEAAE